MSTLRAYAIAPEHIDLFFEQNEEFLEKLAVNDIDALDAFQEAWSEWLKDPGKKRFDSHPVDGNHGDRGWILWRSQFNHIKLRLLFLVHEEERSILPVRLRNDHDYDEHLMATIARKGLGMAKRADEEHREVFLSVLRRQVNGACLSLVSEGR